MLNLFRSKKQVVTGIDIQANGIFLLQLIRTRHTVEANKLAFSALPEDAIVEGKIHNSQIVSQAIKHLVQASDLSGHLAALALPSQSVITKQIKLTHTLTQAECEAEIHTNLKHYMPGITAELAIDFCMQSATDVLVVAARQQELNEYVRLVSENGLNVKRVDVTTYALTRGARFANPQSTTLGILDVNTQGGQFIIFQAPHILFSYPLRLMDIEQQLSQLAQLCVTTHRELRLSFILLSGKKSLLAPLVNTIEANFQLPALYANPLQVMQKSNVNLGPWQERASEMLISCGLALC